MCVGILNFSKKYGKAVLEECCRQALEVDRPTYSYIKNSVSSVADDMSTEQHVSENINARNQGALAMDTKKMDVDRLLSRSHDLAQSSRKEASDEQDE